MNRRTALTGVMALAGLCFAVGLAYLTSHLSTQRVGLAGESPRAGFKLVAPPPATTTTPAPARKRRHKKRPTPTQTLAAPTPAPAPAPVQTYVPPPPPQTVVVTVPARTTAPARTTPSSTQRQGRDDSRDGSGGTGGKRDD